MTDLTNEILALNGHKPRTWLRPANPAPLHLTHKWTLHESDGCYRRFTSAQAAIGSLVELKDHGAFIRDPDGRQISYVEALNLRRVEARYVVQEEDRCQQH